VPKVSERHRTERRRQILDAAVECFARDGFHKTSMHDIVREAGVSAGTIYGYFAGKEDIIEAIADERHATESALIAEALGSGDVADALHRLAGAYLQWLRDPEESRRRRVNVQVWAEALHDERVAAIVGRGSGQRALAAQAVARARESGRIRRDLDPDAVSRVMLSVLLGFILQQAWEPTIDVDAYADVVDALIDGLVAPAGSR
jgi:AcrR family transcriptional regulator